MRELHASIISSLDGFYESDGTYSFARGYEEDEFARYANEMLRGYDTLMFGRKTYLLGLKNYQTAPTVASARFQENMNAHTHVVFSDTLTDEELAWGGNTVRYRNDVVGNVTALKQQPGKDILLIGSTSVRSELMNAGLVDRLKIWYFPIALGSGSSLFKGLTGTARFKMMRAYTFHNGIIRVEYDVLPPEDATATE